MLPSCPPSPLPAVSTKHEGKIRCAVFTFSPNEAGERRAKGRGRRAGGGAKEDPKVEFWTGDSKGLICKWQVQNANEGEKPVENPISQTGSLTAPGAICRMILLNLEGNNRRVMVGCEAGEVVVVALQVPHPSTKVNLNQKAMGCALYIEKSGRVWTTVGEEIFVWTDLVGKPGGMKGSRLGGGAGRGWTLVTTMKEHTSKIMHLCLLRNMLVCSSSADGSIILWDSERCVPRQRLVGHSGGVGWVGPAGDGWGVWSGAEDEGVWLWSGNNPPEKKSEMEEEGCSFRLKKFIEGEEEEDGGEGEKGGQGEGGEGGFVAVEIGDGVGVEDRMKMIDVNIGGLKEMVKEAKGLEEVEKALELCALVVKDLKKVISLVGGEGPVMADVEDRITVTITQKKQLMARKRAMKKAAAE